LYEEFKIDILYIFVGTHKITEEILFVESASDIWLSLQSLLSAVFTSFGNITHADWRGGDSGVCV
jgi:hypothetical protein